MYDVQDIIQGNVRTMTMPDVVRKSYNRCVQFTYVLESLRESLRKMANKVEMRSFDGELIEITDTKIETPQRVVETEVRRILFSPMSTSTPKSSGNQSSSSSYVEMSSIHWRNDELKLKVEALGQTIQSLEHTLSVLKAQKIELENLID